jgi:hypothetical protein
MSACLVKVTFISFSSCEQGQSSQLWPFGFRRTGWTQEVIWITAGEQGIDPGSGLVIRDADLADELPPYLVQLGEGAVDGADRA